jgi:hypothetical protein
LLSSSFNFFLFHYLTLGYSAFCFVIFFYFFSIRLFQYHISDNKLLELTPVNSGFSFNFLFIYLLQFHILLFSLLESWFSLFVFYKVSISQEGGDFCMLTRVMFFCLFLNWFFIYFSSFNVLLVGNWALNFFLWNYLVLIYFLFLSNNIIEIF